MSLAIEVGDVRHQKYPSCFFFSIDAGCVVVDHAALALRRASRAASPG